MLLSTAKRSFICLLGSTALVSSQSSSSSCCTPDITFTTDNYRSQLLDNYLGFWAGNYSLIDQVFSPNMSLIQDRLPIGKIEIHNTSALQAWVDHSRGGWSQFIIKPWYWFASDYHIALRWYLDGVIANVSAHAPGSKLPDNSSVTYNGTDSIMLDPCTGKIVEVDSAQDFITYFYNLGLSSIPT